MPEAFVVTPAARPAPLNVVGEKMTFARLVRYHMKCGEKPPAR